jgi:hypothetical protein
MYNIKVKILCFCLLSGLFTGLRAQDTDFWFVAPHMSDDTDGTIRYYPAFLAISNNTDQTAHSVITIYNGGSLITLRDTIAPGGFAKHDFNTPTTIMQVVNPRNRAGNVVEYGIHITSDVTVSAYYMHNQAGSRDIWTLKGSQALGTLFYVPLQSDNAAANTWTGIDQVDIVATEDDTEVEITPKGNIRLYDATGESYTVIAAGTIIRDTMNMGETLKLSEYTQNESPTLTGTKIASDKPIAVTVTEDGAGGDTSGDQIVPVSSLGTRYVVPRGYRTNVALERFYLVAAYPGTTVNIYASTISPNPDATISLANPGDAARYTFPTGANAVYVEASQPVYLYHRTGYAEEGAALIPSVYAIGQTQLSFLQVAGQDVQKGFLFFRTGAEGGFTISYGSVANEPMDLTGTIDDVPNEPDWKVSRFNLPGAATGLVVTIKSSQSPFSFGYITGGTSNNNSYGYFSAFGTFEFPDTTYMCGNSVTLQGGYALSYLWTYPDGVTTAITPSITVTQEGFYTLEMNQDPNLLVATTYVKKVNAGTVSPASQFVCEGNQPATLTVAEPADGLSGAPFQWQSSTDGTTWTNITGATAATYSPGILNAPSGITQSIYYRRGATSSYCGIAYSNAVEVKVSPCAVIVNPHLRTRVNY